MEKGKFLSVVCFLAAAIFSLIVLGAGGYVLSRPPHDNWIMLAAGCLCCVLVILAAAVSGSIGRIPRRTPEESLAPISERLDQLAILLNLMSEQQLLSDRAVSIVYRDKDREALRRAVHEEMGRKDWEAALSLVDEMERAFGYKAESQRLRKEINDSRQDVVRKQINDVVQTIDKHTRAEQWNAAIREADKLIQLFPDNEQVRNLPHEIDSRRQAHKKQLIQKWHDAVARHDVDGSIDILKQLDPYLTPSEAEGLQETVRGVFKEKLTGLGAQFAAAVKEQRIPEAIRIGESINREFPNTRIAQEVRDMMDALKKRAEPATASAVATA